MGYLLRLSEFGFIIARKVHKRKILLDVPINPIKLLNLRNLNNRWMSFKKIIFVKMYLACKMRPCDCGGIYESWIVVYFLDLCVLSRVFRLECGEKGYVRYGL